MPFDGKEFGETIVGIVRQSIGEALGAFRERLARLEERKGVDTVAGDIVAIRERLARLEERKPEKGEPGKDGLSVKDFDVRVLEDDRTIELTLKAEDGEEFVATLKWPNVIDRGVFKDTGEYERGDAVTWAGSLWIAQREAPGKPGEGDGWRLAVKRGRDGKDARPNG